MCLIFLLHILFNIFFSFAFAVFPFGLILSICANVANSLCDRSKRKQASNELTAVSPSAGQWGFLLFFRYLLLLLQGISLVGLQRFLVSFSFKNHNWIYQKRKCLLCASECMCVNWACQAFDSILARITYWSMCVFVCMSVEKTCLCRFGLCNLTCQRLNCFVA